MLDLKSIDEAIQCGQLPFELLNAFVPEPLGWKKTRANKSHEDLFGSVVQSGHSYYVRRVGGGFADVEKLSQASMDHILIVMFGSNRGLVDHAREVLQARHAKLWADMRSSPG